MENELEVIERHDLSVNRSPLEVLAEAKRAAEALKDVISKKSKPVMFGGEQYLEFEDLQTLGRFYGVTAKVTGSSPLQIGESSGFEARAIAILTATGQEISAADAMCMDDEKNWKEKPAFQLRSMAQTRACAKALRNVLAWVVVLAGYKATPAEEMSEPGANAGQENGSSQPTEKISEAQRKRFYAIAKGSGKSDDEIKFFLAGKIGSEKTNDITKNQYETLCTEVAKK